MDPILRARQLVVDYFNSRSEKTDRFMLEIDQVYAVWFCYILGGWKALVSTTQHDGMYYEVTHNASAHETYVDAYKKWDNIHVPD